jgi:hypothetical protein
MKKLLILLIALCIGQTAQAETYAYYGVYGDSTLQAYPNSAQDGVYARHRAGIRIEKVIKDGSGIVFTPFVENETLIDRVAGYNFSPASTNFSLGVKADIDNISFLIKHECRHAYEERAKEGEQYNLIEVRYYLDREK